MSRPDTNYGSAQILHQFSETKLGKFRVGKSRNQESKNDSISSPGIEWKMILTFVAINLILLAVSLSLLLSGYMVPGWCVLGVWGFLTLSGVVFIIFYCCTAGKMAGKNDIEMTLKETRDDKFPCDPVMQRAIVNLVYHGQQDCSECRLHRHREENQRMQRLKIQGGLGSSTANMERSSYGYCDDTNTANHNGHTHNHVQRPETDNAHRVQPIKSDLNDEYLKEVPRVQVVEAVIESSGDSYTQLDYIDDDYKENYDVINHHNKNNSNNSTSGNDVIHSEEIHDSDANPNLSRRASDSTIFEAIRQKSSESREKKARSLSRESARNVRRSRDYKAGKYDNRERRPKYPRDNSIPTKRRNRTKKSHSRRHREKSAHHNNDIMTYESNNNKNYQQKTRIMNHNDNLSYQNDDPFLDYCIKNNLKLSTHQKSDYQTFEQNIVSPPSGYEESNKYNRGRNKRRYEEEPYVHHKEDRRKHPIKSQSYKHAPATPTSSNNSSQSTSTQSLRDDKAMLIRRH